MLEDNDVLHARQGAWGIFNAKFTDRHAAVPRALETLDMEVAQIMKGGCGTESCTLLLVCFAAANRLLCLTLRSGGHRLPIMILCCRYDHFMQKEIHEQPESILQTMRGRVAFRRNSREDMVGVTAVCSIARIE